MRGIQPTLARRRTAPETAVRRALTGSLSAPDPTVLRALVIGVAIVQSVVLGLLARRGHWLSDDLEFLVQGGQGFAPRELLTPLNDHIAPGLRFVYATFAELAPLNWDFTVVSRVLLQALAIALLGLLLLRLLGSSWWVLTGTVVYALTPLSMPSFMSLSSGVNNLPAHVFGLLLLHATVDWSTGRRRRAVAYGPLSVLISLACWEKSGLILVTALALSLYLREIPLKLWLRRTWPYAAALTVPIIAFGILYAVNGNPSAGHLPGFGTLVELAGKSFAVPLGALAGGPWNWSPVAGVFGLADAPAVVPVLGGIVAVVLLVTAWRQDRRVLLLWGSVAVYTLVTLVLVSYGRFDGFGDVFTVHYHYWSDLSIPLTLAVVLTAKSLRIPPLVAVGVGLAWAAGSVVSLATFAQTWDDNPSRPYFTTLRAELESAGPAVNLWDTRLPESLSIALSADPRISPVLRTAGIPFQLQSSASEPRMVDDTGRIRPAHLSAWAKDVIPPKEKGICSVVLQGAETMTFPLRATTAEHPTANWFVKIGYLSSREDTVAVELVGTDGRAVAVPPAARAAWPAGLANSYLGPAPMTDLAAVRIRTTDPRTNLCIGNIEIGLPQVSE
ncbi:hypothetical protein [Kribbella lupini]|uniref:Glycosyltransferase RgtA/B/C/D-like domain-containing protein n=1 Tax=Kribbella lupini TaxID=291602 RepID=A0ABN2A9F2_9ACTN